jgi:hypothetical protein
VALAVRACATGAVAVGVLLGAAWAFVPAEARPLALVGFGLALLTGCTGLGAMACLGTVSHTDPSAGQRYLIALAGNLLLQFVAAGLGLLMVFSISEKFQSAAVFGLTFAATASVLQLCGSLVISAALRARHAARQGRHDSAPHDPTGGNVSRSRSQSPENSATR